MKSQPPIIQLWWSWVNQGVSSHPPGGGYRFSSLPFPEQCTQLRGRGPCRWLQGRKPCAGTWLPAAQLLCCYLWPQPQFSTEDYRLAAVNYPSQINSPRHAATSGIAFLGNRSRSLRAFSLLLSSKLPGEDYLPNAKVKRKRKCMQLVIIIFLKKILFNQC